MDPNIPSDESLIDQQSKLAKAGKAGKAGLLVWSNVNDEGGSGQLEVFDSVNFIATARLPRQGYRGGRKG